MEVACIVISVNERKWISFPTMLLGFENHKDSNWDNLKEYIYTQHHSAAITVVLLLGL